MASCFQRNVPTISSKNLSSTNLISSKLSGTKPFINGQRLISSGLAYLDEILGGGLPLHSLVLFESTTSMSNNVDFHRYFLGEGVVSDHVCVVTGDYFEEELNDFVKQLLPLELGYLKHMNQESSILEDSFSLEESNHLHSEEKLRIAWQYTKYQNNHVSLNKSRFCHSYDLNRSMPMEIIKTNPVHVFSIQDKNYLETFQLFLRKTCQDYLDRVYRVSIRLELSFEDICSYQQLMNFFIQLNEIVSTFPMVCYISFRQHLHPSWLNHRIAHLCHFVFRVDDDVHQIKKTYDSSFDENINGFFHIIKLPNHRSLTFHQMKHRSFVLRRDKRKLHIQPLHLPPQHSRSSTNSSTCSSTSSTLKTTNSSSSSCNSFQF